MRDLVCVSFQGPPVNNAEALCTSRLLTQLAKNDFNVTLVTADREAPQLSHSLMGELVSKKVRIVKIPFAPSRGTERILPMARHWFHGEAVEWVRAATEVTRNILKKSKEPILMSRGFPVASNLVGYNCADHAAKWVCHFSDPFPPRDVSSHWYSGLGKPLNTFWARRLVNRADLVTFTCKNAYRYMAQGINSDFKHKSHVLTHLALPKLLDGTEEVEIGTGFVLGHIGGLWKTRRARLLLDGLSIAKNTVSDLKLVVLGAVDGEIVKMIEERGLGDVVVVRHDRNLDPRAAQTYMKKMSVNVACEKEYGLDYSPMLLSKYVHGVAVGRPQLMLGRDDSAMGDYTRDFGGGVLIGDEKAASVADAIIELRENHGSSSVFSPSKAHIMEFSPDRIIPPFLKALSAA